MTLHVSEHAIRRYQERVANVPYAEADCALRSPAVLTAARIGAPFVRLPGKQRIVIVDNVVVTVLPPQGGRGCLARSADFG